MNRSKGQSYGLPTFPSVVGTVGESLVQTKTCTKCGKSLPATPEYFHRTKSTNDGLHTRCKPCRTAQDRAYWHANAADINARRRAAYPEHRERNILYHRRWRTEQRQKYLDGKRRWYEANREHDNAKSRKWREKNRERKAAYDRAYADQNREKIRAKKQRWERKMRSQRRKNPEMLHSYRTRKRLSEQVRKARKLGLASQFCEADWQHALAYFDNCCAVCGRRLDGLFHTAAADHWIPLSSPDCPGTVPSNIVPLCHGIDGCNNSKHSRNPGEWLQWKFGRARARAIARKIARFLKSVS